MPYIECHAEDAAAFEIEALKDTGLELAETYAAGEPFPHIVIDDFLPEALIDLCLSAFPETPDRDSAAFNRAQERHKTSYHPDYLPPNLRNLFYAFNARPFIKVIENITGVKGLIPDPYFLGGGFHEIANGGHLSVHADFNHHKPMNLERRINVLIYLNRDWREEYGGQLELWRADMSQCVHSIAPIANRCAIFTTSQASMHGNPQIVAHPDGVTRKSIALYYYTATWDALKNPKTTQFRRRPGSADGTDWDVRIDEAITEFAPPILGRRLLRVLRRLRRTS